MSVPHSVFISSQLQAYKQNHKDWLNDGGYVGMVVVPEEAFPLPFTPLVPSIAAQILYHIRGT